MYTPFPGAVAGQRPNIIPYTPGAVHFDGVTYLQCDSLVLPEIGIDAGTDGFGLTISFWAKTVWDNTFTPIGPAGQGNIIPLFVVDPQINYGPSIVAQTPNSALFVVLVDALYDGNLNPIIPCQIMYTRDAVNWYQASIPGQGVQISPRGGTGFENGTWVFELGFPDGNFSNSQPEIADSVIYSYDGINWKLAWEATNIAGGIIFATVEYPSNNPSIGNGVNITNINFVPPSEVFNIFIPFKNPAPGSDNKPFNVVFGDSGSNPSPSSVNILVDPSQVGLTLTGFTSYSLNHLPSPVTAFRIKLPNDSQVQTEYTQTPITQAIVDGDFAGATWHTGFLNSSNGCDWFYSLPSGAPVGDGKNVGAPGGTPTNPSVQTSIVGEVCDNFSEITTGVQDQLNSWAISSLIGPVASYGKPYKDFIVNGPLWQEPVWMHFMFTFDSDAGHANIYINGIKVDLSGSSLAGGANLGLGTALPFVTRLNQKTAAIGGDSLGSFFIGDIADFSVWNVNLGEITVITADNRQGLPSPYNIFLDPSNNSPTSPSFQASMVHYITSNRSGLDVNNFVIRQAVVMLTGNAVDFPQNTLGSAQPFRLVRGFLTSAATVPLFISAP